MLLCAAAIPAGLACLANVPTPEAAAGFNRYVAGVDARLAREHQGPGAFLATAAFDSPNEMRLRRGGFVLEELTPSPGLPLPGALLHDWRGTAFVPGATTAEFEQLMRDFGAWPQRFAPQVVDATVLAQDGDDYQVRMRIRQRHAITVILDAAYDVRFTRWDAQHGASVSRSTAIDEIGSDGLPLSPAGEHGFLWRMDTWWSYEERDGGLYVQIESVSLTRSIPTGLGWVVGPFVESVPRDSLTFTLRSVCDALRR